MVRAVLCRFRITCDKMWYKRPFLTSGIKNIIHDYQTGKYGLKGQKNGIAIKNKFGHVNYFTIMP